MADRYDSLRHQALMATVGSMKRRWEEDLYVAPPDSLEDFFANESPADGLVIADEMGAAIRQLELLNLAIRTTSYLEPEPLQEFVVEAARNELDGPRPASGSAGVSRLTSLNEEIYERLDTLRIENWKNEATWGGLSLSISDLAKGVSRVNVERLNRATRALTSQN